MIQPSQQETVLADLPGSTDRDRTLLVMRQRPGQDPLVELRQQTWGEGVGWFTQSSVALATHQVAGLRNALGIAGCQAKACRTMRPATVEQPTHLRVLHADSA